MQRCGAHLLQTQASVFRAAWRACGREGGALDDLFAGQDKRYIQTLFRSEETTYRIVLKRALTESVGGRSDDVVSRARIIDREHRYSFKETCRASMEQLHNMTTMS